MLLSDSVPPCLPSRTAPGTAEPGSLVLFHPILARHFVQPNSRGCLNDQNQGGYEGRRIHQERDRGEIVVER